MQYSDKRLLSEIGASIEKMCKMKNASFFLNFRKRKLHVKISPDLYDLLPFQAKLLTEDPKKGSIQV